MMTRYLGMQIRIVLAWAGFATVSLFAQSVDVFRAMEKQPPGDSESATPKPTATDLEALKSKPSRFAVNAVDAYVSAKLDILTMKSRTLDPFVLNQNPEIKTEIKTIRDLPTSTKPTALPTIPLSEIVKLIKVSTVILKDKSFLVGDRSFKELDEIPISFEGRKKRLQVLKVTAAEIHFRDIDTKEDAILKIDVLPFGMLSGDSKLRPEGMISPDQNRDLELEIENNSSNSANPVENRLPF